MQNLPNIEPSAFRKGEYVGYAAGGVWRIRKFSSRRWQATTSQQLPLPGKEPAFYVSEARTLKELSEGLTRFHRKHV